MPSSLSGAVCFPLVLEEKRASMCVCARVCVRVSRFLGWNGTRTTCQPVFMKRMERSIALIVLCDHVALL